MMRVREIRYASRDAAGGSVDLLQATPYLRRGQMRAVGPHSPEFEAVLVAMHVDFALHADEEYGHAACAILALSRKLLSKECMQHALSCQSVVLSQWYAGEEHVCLP